MEKYKIKLEMFEGPFDLLLHLIDKNEVDIYDIPIAEITSQYLEYIEQLKELDLDVAGEFLVMAATLLAIKAKMLLPKPPAEEIEDPEDFDPRTQLVKDLLEYKKIKEAAVCLEEHYLSRQKLHARDNDISLYSNLFGEENPLEGKTLNDLTAAFYSIWQKVKEEKITLSIKKNIISIGGMMDEIYNVIRTRNDGIMFTDILLKYNSKIHLIVGFIALLELIKSNTVKVYQDKIFGQIYIMPGDTENYEMHAENTYLTENVEFLN
ncbi:MAG: segregation and condensation protein A [Bacillota bacterium]|jgi:segregation and condensation protein A